MAKKKNNNKINDELKKQEEDNKRERVEEAKKIASRSQQIIDKNYNAVAKRTVKIFRMFNNFLDYILENGFLSKIAALLIAIALYASVNYSGDISVYGQSNFGKELYGVKVEALYDDNKYQVENLPETVDLSLIGSIEAIRKTQSVNQEKVIVDLTNYKAGLNQKVTLMYGGVANGVSVKFSQPTYEVNIFDKYKEDFKITPELIRVPIDEKYDYQIDYQTTSIEIRAAQHTLDSIASVKALVDVEGKNKDFEQKAELVVIDNEGNKIEGITLSIKSIDVKVKVKKVKDGK